MEVETKVCSLCKVEKPIEDNFYTSWHNLHKKRYVRSQCNPCHQVVNHRSHLRWKLKRRLKAAAKNIHLRAITRIIADDPDLITLVVNKNPLKFKKYMREEHIKVFYETKADAVKFAGKRHGEQAELMWKELEEELRQGKLF